MIEILNVA